MTSRPHISWPLALGIAGIGRGNQLEPVDEVVTRQALRVASRQAAPLAEEYSRLPGKSAAEVVVVDGPGWAQQTASMVEGLLDRMWPNAATRWWHRLGGLGYGVVAGVALRAAGRGLLGQYDPLADRLLLLAPNLRDQQLRHHFVAEDFFLWVAIHEHTHAVQFHSAPWLLPLLTELVTEVADENLNLSRGGQHTLTRLQALMTLLEGHADYVADTAGRTRIPSLRRLRAAFSHETPNSMLARLLPGVDKSAQYRQGLAFCKGVGLRAGRDGLRPAFAAAENLPTIAEIHDPQAWLRRVHG